LGYRPHVFRATGPGGEDLYHTNVLMCVGTGFAAACLEAVADAVERRDLRESLMRGAELIELDRQQMNSFAGNMLALRSVDGTPVVAMSGTAWHVLRPGQRAQLERQGAIATAALPTIERCGGGSLRCMLAEVFLPRIEGPAARIG